MDDDRGDLRAVDAPLLVVFDEPLAQRFVGIQILVMHVPILSPEFDKKLDALGSDEARASEMEHAIRHEIHVKLGEDPAF